MPGRTLESQSCASADFPFSVCSMSSSQGIHTISTRVVPPECCCCPLDTTVLPSMIICSTPGFKRIPASDLLTLATNVSLFLRNIPWVSSVITIQMSNMITMLLTRKCLVVYGHRRGRLILFKKSAQQNCQVVECSMSNLPFSIYSGQDR